MKMNKIALACGAALMGASALAQAELSANIGATSNYVWRGVTQTDNKAAISGGVDYSNDSGVYLGTWASNVDGGAELDLYGGFGGEMGGVGYDVGAIYYAYPQADDSDFVEIYGSATFSMFTVGLAYTVSGQNDGGAFDDGDIYYYASASFDLPQDFSLGATIGRYDFENTDDYTHYQLDLGKSAGDFGDFTFSVSDTDTAGSDPLVFVSWAKSF